MTYVALISENSCSLASRIFASRHAGALNVPQHFLELLILIEDKRFPGHFGIDPLAMLRALHHNLARKGFRQGASTMTQQIHMIRVTQKTGVYQRGFRTKLPQIAFGLWLSHRATKVSVLSEYIDGVYWGRNYYGLDDAALGYFSKHRSQLSFEESFFLAERLAGPNRFSPQRLEVILRRKSVASVIASYGTSSQAITKFYSNRVQILLRSKIL